MNQNSIIAFALLVGFVVFVTMRGELQQYLAVVGLSSATLPGASVTPGAASNSGVASLPNLPGLGINNLVPAPSVSPILETGSAPTGSITSLIG